MNQANKYILSFIVVLSFCFLATNSFNNAYARGAGILVFPTKIVINERQRSFELTLKNNGTARGLYRLELVDFVKDKNGAMKELPKGEQSSNSAQKMIRISPRRSVIDNGSVQNIRLVVRKPKDLSDGEYRSHLKVTLAENNVDSYGRPPSKKNNGSAFGVLVKPRINVVLPILLLEGETFFEVKLDNPKLVFEDQHAYLNLTLLRSGNKTAVGNLKVMHVSPSGSETILKFHTGLAVYHPYPSNNVKIDLKVPDSVDLLSGKLIISYLDRDNEDGDVVLAKTELQL